MESLLFSINAVVPMFLLISAGYVIQRLGLLSVSTVQELNRSCFNLFIPCVMFNSVYSANIRENSYFSLIIFALVALSAAVTLLILVIPKLVSSRPRAGSIIQGSYRGNLALFGTALAVSLFGQEGLLPMSLLVAVIVPCFNVIAIVVLTLFGEKNDAEQSLSATLILQNILKNPLIIGITSALVLSLFDLSLPNVLYSPIQDLAKTGTPLALLVIGAQFDFGRAANQLRYSMMAVLFKIVMFPLAVTVFAVLLGFRGPELGVLFLFSVAPTNSGSYVMAQNMGCDGPLAGDIVLFSAVFSIIPIFFGTLLLKFFGLF